MANRIACEVCGNDRAWILTQHPVTKKIVCLECAKRAPEGWVACHGTHQNGASTCLMCRETPGFLETV